MPISKVCLEHILLDHAVGVEERSINGDGVEHHVDKTISVFIIHGNDHPLQFFILQSPW
jgi:hypothetical protein